MNMSEWVLSQLISPPQEQFQDVLTRLASSDSPTYEFAELLDLLESLGPHEFEAAVSEPPRDRLEPYWNAYVAATVEHVASQKHSKPPRWTRDVPPLDEPAFGSTLMSLREHLLMHSPPAYAQRNIFITATSGGRV